MNDAILGVIQPPWTCFVLFFLYGRANNPYALGLLQRLN